MGVAGPVTGASDHYARAELVTLAVEDGAPVLVERRRVELIAKGLPSTPYHHEALHMELGAAVDLVDRVRRSVAQHARAAIATLLATCRSRVLVLRASPFDHLPDRLEEVLSSRPLTLAADGMLYRESLAQAAAERGMEVRRFPRKTDPMALAAEAVGVEVAEIRSLVAQLGREAGVPWRKDHKMAAAAALGALGYRIRRRAAPYGAQPPRGGSGGPLGAS